MPMNSLDLALQRLWRRNQVADFQRLNPMQPIPLYPKLPNAIYRLSLQRMPETSDTRLLTLDLKVWMLRKDFLIA